MKILAICRDSKFLTYPRHLVNLFSSCTIFCYFYSYKYYLTVIQESNFRCWKEFNKIYELYKKQ